MIRLYIVMIIQVGQLHARAEQNEHLVPGRRAIRITAWPGCRPSSTFFKVFRFPLLISVGGMVL